MLRCRLWGYERWKIAELTNLSTREANLARQRDFDEPFIFPGKPDQRFLRAIEEIDLQWTEGRFFHIMVIMIRVKLCIY